MTRSKEKPNGEDAGWKFIGSEVRFEGKVFRVREDEVELAGARRIKYAYAERGAAVVIVPVTDAGEMVLLKQYRYAIDQWCLEVPAGGTHDTGDDSLEEVARNELREEVGATAKKLTQVDFFYSASGITDEKCHVFFAEGVELSSPPKRDAGETIELQLTSVAEALELARNGAIKTAPCALAILLCASYLEKYLRPETPDEFLET